MDGILDMKPITNQKIFYLQDLMILFFIFILELEKYCGQIFEVST